jgi:hypothetical protein
MSYQHSSLRDNYCGISGHFGWLVYAAVTNTQALQRFSLNLQHYIQSAD